jgi:hypothetical protein
MIPIVTVFFFIFFLQYYDGLKVLTIWLLITSFCSYVTVSRSFFCKTIGHSDITEGLEYFRGYYQSLCPTQMGPELTKPVALATGQPQVVLW